MTKAVTPNGKQEKKLKTGFTPFTEMIQKRKKLIRGTLASLLKTTTEPIR